MDEAADLKGPKEPGLVIMLVWDPGVLIPEDYARLVEVIGDLVRANGGVGICRLAQKTITVEAKRRSEET